MKNLERRDIPVEHIVPNPRNPNRMGTREFDLLVENIEVLGFTDPVLVRPIEDDKYEVVGGHHRLEAAKYLEYAEVPCTIILDEEFDEEAADFQLVRHNVIKGRMDPEKFIDLYNKHSEKYGDEVLQDMFGFAEESEFRRLIASTKDSLPIEMQEKFAEAAKEIKTIDGLAALLNRMFTEHGDTLDHGYMVIDFGGKDSIWLRCNRQTFQSCLKVGESLREKKRTMDDIFGGIMTMIAEGELEEVVQKLVESSREVAIPLEVEVPTYDEVESYDL